MPLVPVEVGQLRRHPKGHMLRVVRIYHKGREYACADCVPDPAVAGRRATNIATRTLATYPLITTTEPS